MKTGVPVDQELLTALRSRLSQLEERACELEAQVLAAQARVDALAIGARASSEEAEKDLVAALVPWARRESVAIVEDARRRAAELRGNDAPSELWDLGRWLVSYFELQERLVQLVREMAFGAPGLDGHP